MWTKNIPTEYGYYWARKEKTDVPQVVLMYGGNVYGIAVSGAIPENMYEYWSNPIPFPEG